MSRPTTETPRTPTAELTDLQARMLEATAALAQTGQRVLEEAIDLSARAARESVRACAELQILALDAARQAPGVLPDPAVLASELRQDPWAWHRRSLAATAAGAQQTLRWLEAQTQVWSRSAERLQGSAAEAGKHLQEVFTSCADRLRQIYGA